MTETATPIATGSTTEATSLLYDVREAAELLRVSRSTLYGLIRDGAVVSIKIRRRRLIPRESLEAYLASLPTAS